LSLSVEAAGGRVNSAIPFLDLVTPHLELEDELVSVFRAALKSAAFVGGAAVEAFEREFAAFCDAGHAVGTSSGTDALRFALSAAGVGKDDIVLTVPNTFNATAAAITQAGARPDFIDINPRTYTMDPERLRSYLANDCMPDLYSRGVVNLRTGNRVKAVVPVHLYGQMADMDPILDLAARYDLVVVEDACQAHGAEYFSNRQQRWRRAGTMGTAAAFSFYPGKNLGACGEAGAVVTNDEEVARKCRMLRDHGQSSKYFHDFEGYNGRLDAIQAGFLRVKLSRLDGWTEARRERARVYDDLFAGTDRVGIPHVPRWSRPVYHLYVVRVPQRDLVQRELASHGIGTAIHYPIPLHLCRAYEHLRCAANAFPVAAEAAGEILSLPMYPGLTTDQQKRVVAAVREAVGRVILSERRSA
jgi:dTDP-4-amino-4,6-dideoxygalactose transaminase